MKEIKTEELRELQMQILDYVDAFCRKYGIKYTISGGTLLGAIRHGGFIPWDDDMDIQMLRDEYNRFTEVWNQHKGEHGYFELVNIESGNSMGYPFGKVHDTRTVTYIGKLKRTGVYIDVFPVDAVKDMADFEARHNKVKELYKERSCAFNNLKAQVEKPTLKERLRLILFSKHTTKDFFQLAEIINSVALECNGEKCPLVYEMIAGLKCNQPIPVEVFSDYVDVAFEDRSYMSVSDYDKYLTLTFGDYMTPPPAKKRVEHSFVPYWK